MDMFRLRRVTDCALQVVLFVRRFHQCHIEAHLPLVPTQKIQSAGL